PLSQPAVPADRTGARRGVERGEEPAGVGGSAAAAVQPAGRPSRPTSESEGTARPRAGGPAAGGRRPRAAPGAPGRAADPVVTPDRTQKGRPSRPARAALVGSDAQAGSPSRSRPSVSHRSR